MKDMCISIAPSLPTGPVCPSPQEWLTLSYELAVALVLGWTPPSLAPFTLWTSWTNKVGVE
jgi:hypothetical protein